MTAVAPGKIWVYNSEAAPRPGPEIKSCQGDSMDFMLSVSVVLPLCIYIGVGVLANKLKLLDDKTISTVNKFLFKILFPLMMFDNMLSAGNAISGEGFGLVLYLFIVLTVIFLLLFLLVPRFVKSKPRQGSFIQGAFRANFILFALPVVTALCGDENTALASMCIAVLVPYNNVLAVLALEGSRGGKVKLRSLLKSIVTNPLIIGAIAGAAFLLTGLEMPDLLRKTIKNMTSMNTPLSLMLLGAGLKFAGLKRDILPLSAVCAVKLVIMPVVTVAGAMALGFEGVPLITAFGLSCVPTAVSSYTMAEQMGADGPFAAEVVATTTVTSIVTVFLGVLALSAMGIV